MSETTERVLLRVVPWEEIDEPTRKHFALTAKQAKCNYTIFEGMVTSHIYICMHKGPKPTEGFIKAHEAIEFAALPTEGATQ